MKVQSKWFLSAVVGFVAVVLVTALSSFGTLKTNVQSQKGHFLVSSIAKIEKVN